MTWSRSVARDCALILSGCFLLHIAGTWALPLCDRDEPRFAEASREMLQRGDWIVPWFNHQPRYDKPPLVYWCQMLAYRCFGENEFSARLPSVIASALTALAIYGFGSRMRNRVAGIWAAILFSTCVGTFVHSKLAVADMLMVLFFTTATWSAWELTRNSPETPEPRLTPCGNWWLALNSSLALAFLAKGPVGLLPILFPFLAAKLSRLRMPTRQVRPAVTGLVVLALVALWGVPALVRTHGEFWDVGMGKHVFQRSLGAMEGHGGKNWLQYVASLPFYFMMVFANTFPWSIWLVWLGKRLWLRRSSLIYDEAFLVVGVLTVFIVFTFVWTKLFHYTLPAFPLLFLLLVREWQDAATSIQLPRRLAIAMGVAALTLSLLAFPLVAPLFPSAQLAKQCASWLKPEMELASGDFAEASLCWQFRGYIRGFHEILKVEELPAFMTKSGPRVCVLPTINVAANFPSLPPSWHSIRVTGFNLGKGRRVDLTALVKPDATDSKP